MKKHIFFCLTIWMIMQFPAAGQDTPADKPEPEDPGIILPAVVLEIEDLSVEKVDAGLPEGSDIALPERELLINDDITLDIKDVQFNIDAAGNGLEPDNVQKDINGTQPGYVTGAGGLVSAEAMLGAGNAGSLLSRISFYKSGNLPRFKFLFDHETVDGYAFQAAGTGFSSRYDELLASILFNIRKLEMDTSVNFRDNELGLQGQGNYFSLINRFITGNGNFKLKVSDLFTFSADMGGDITTFILTGGQAPAYALQYPPTEILLSPEILGTFSMDSVNLGISADYKYRTVPGTAAYDFHRLLLQTDLKIILPFWLDIAGNVAFFRSSTVPMLFPFQLTFSGTPSRSFSFSLKGGYFLDENNFSNLLADISYLDIPAPPDDNYGWFGAAAANLNLADNSLGINLDTTVRWNKNYYYRGTTIDPQTALFSLNSYTDILSSVIKTGIQWTIIEGIKLDFAFDSTILWAAAGPEADNQFRLTGDFRTTDDKLGATLEAVLDADTGIVLDLPVLNTSLDYKIMSNVNLVCEAEDILSPLLTSPRVLAAPYITPGVRGLIKIEINF